MDINKIKETILAVETNYPNFNDNILNYFDDDELKEVNDLDDLETLLRDANNNYDITDTQFIYYADAIAYLAEHDQSLNDSINLAIDAGFELKDINSEKLASLLKSGNNVDEYNDFIDDVIKALK